ncbi:Aste57867_1537 [Aphanomyces stellatus]|uniref:Aste57867_1537 protein n=1 Tax=Aphanomyces stellatus TaxID=120398 RepID=A0A485K8W3_9STRA|nr:hypothetical protein As57867_001536 [Aphanomyces stellatus]VFT78752.1 Aste57867_1537 [Aphanomyces stellatus]
MIPSRCPSHPVRLTEPTCASAHEVDFEAPPSDNRVDSCTIPMLFLIGAPRLAMNMAWSAQWAALGPLLQILLPSWAVQLVQVIGPITGLVVAPTVGVLSDNCTSGYGRRRPFLFGGAIASCLCWFLMMHTTDLGKALGDTPDRRHWTAFFTVFCYVWMDITVNIAQVPATLIIADFAGERQVLGSSIGLAYALSGSFFVAGYIWIFGPAHEHIKAFLAMLMGIMLFTTMAVCLFVKEKPLIPTFLPSTSRTVQDALAAVYTGVRHLPRPLALYCFLFCIIQYGYTAYSSSRGQFFGLVVMGGSEHGADICVQHANCTIEQQNFNHGVRLAGGITDTLANVVGLLFLLCLPWLVRRFGAKRVLVTALVPQTFFIGLAFCKNVPVDIALVSLGSISQAAVFALQMPVIVHVVGFGEQNRLGLFAGAFNSANCVGQLLNFALASVLVTSPLGYALPVLVGGVVTLIALFVSIAKWQVRLHTL